MSCINIGPPLIVTIVAAFATLGAVRATGGTHPPRSQERLVEWTFESRKHYADPFNDVDVDVVFSRGGKSWRVPAFWRADNKWSVRFAPREPGEYAYTLESTDPSNPDLNGHSGKIDIAAYCGPNGLLRHGMLRVSETKRYFEHEDGTPFYWLGDTWYTAFSDRLPWDGFRKLTDDRKSKGFTAIQMAMMTVSNEETAPSDPGFCNEGGCVWDEKFRSINPQYFDYADRRVQYVVDAGMVPVVFGAWRQALSQMGIDKMKRYWRYIIARYGAYPIIWVAGGEIYDPPDNVNAPPGARVTGWTDVVRYIRAIDPYAHPLSVHESPPSFDTPLKEETLTDFDLFQPSHFGWASIAVEIAQLNMHYARTTIRKPLVVGEIGWETLGGEHLEDFQRAAFWLAIANGAAGFSYGNAITGESYSADKTFHRMKFSALTWEEAMRFSSPRQLGLGANLLRNYPWWDFAPHPEWVTPGGTTLLEPRAEVNGFDIDVMAAFVRIARTDWPRPELELPTGEWQKRKGTFRLPYATGIPGEVRIVYIPSRGFAEGFSGSAPTILELEEGVRYRAFYWDPTLGIKVDLGLLERPARGALLRKDNFDGGKSHWSDVDYPSEQRNGKLIAKGTILSVLRNVHETNLVGAVDLRGETDAALVLRYRDPDNYLAVIYSPKDKAIFVRDRTNGVDGPPLGSTPVPPMKSQVRLTAEVRDDNAILSLSDGKTTVTSPIVDVKTTAAGGVGLMHLDPQEFQSFDNFELRGSLAVPKDNGLDRKLYDAEGVYRGEIRGPRWDDYGRNKRLLLNAYRPERLPFLHDWVLVLEAKRQQPHRASGYKLPRACTGD